MSDYDDLLCAIAHTIHDYRAGEIPAPTREHVEYWISQFDDEVRIPILRELHHVLQRTYVSRRSVVQFLSDLVTRADVAGADSREFWKGAKILGIQKNGTSQQDMRALFGEVLRSELRLNIAECGERSSTLVYLDDAVFTGDRVMSDLLSAHDRIPQGATLHVIVIAIHSSGRYWFETNNRMAEFLKGKEINLRFHRPHIRFETRRSWHDDDGKLIPTDVLRPDEHGQRNPEQRASRLFSSVEGRELLEDQFLRAGIEVQKFAANPNLKLKPLGYSNFKPGFGSLLVTYRNCPNNCPLALWYGDPSYPDSHPLGIWYPLFPRKTYQ